MPEKKVAHLVPGRGKNLVALCGLKNVEWYRDRVSPVCKHCLKQLQHLNEVAK